MYFNSDVSWCGPFWVYFVWDPCASWTYMYIFFTRIGKFSVIVFSNKFSISCFFLLLLVPLWCECWCAWCCPRGPLRYTHLFWILFSFCCSDWVFSVTLSFKLLIRSSALSTLLFITYDIFFISVILFFISDWFYFMFSISIFMFPISLLTFSLR